MMTSLYVVAWCCILSSALAKDAQLVKLYDAVSEGAVCLDGSPPGFYFRQGTGSGNASWVVHFAGGGWCDNEDDCVTRSRTILGSSKEWLPFSPFYGFLSDNPETNAYFNNWNMVFVGYCDGASFAGDVAHPVEWEGTTLYFRGARILRTVISHLLDQGMKNAERVVMTGCSAGGVTTFIQADNVKAMLPSSVSFHAMADAGYFLDIPSVQGEMILRESCMRQLKMQNCSSGVNQDCLKRHPSEQWKCLFAQYTYASISTPIFMLNSDYDTWQLDNSLKLGCVPPYCTEKQMQEFQNFRTTFLSMAQPVTQDQTHGVWIDSCLEHCQTLGDWQWSKILVSGQSAHDTFANWYFGRGGKTNVIDCAFPCNTCEL